MEHKDGVVRVRSSPASWPPVPARWGEQDTQQQLEAAAGIVAPLLGTQIIFLPSVLHVPGYLST